MLLLDTLPMLGNVLLLCFFVFFIFGIIGVQLWAGLLRQRCYLDLPYDLNKYNPKYFYDNEYNYSLPEYVYHIYQYLSIYIKKYFSGTFRHFTYINTLT